MRNGFAAFLMLISSAAAASAQGDVSVTAREVDVSGGPLGFAAQKVVEPKVSPVSPDQVVARVMLFDRNGDGKVATAELSERMQVLVARGDTSGDGSLDDSEIRALTARRLDFVEAARNSQFGRYNFGDLSSRMHILNTITDLRLASAANDEARRIALAFADELETAALANLRTAVAPMLTEVQLAELERNFKDSAGARTMRLTSKDGTAFQVFVIPVDSRTLLAQYQLTPDQVRIATAAIVAFKTEQQFDDVRRSALIAQMKNVLSDEESDNFRAALARRPIVGAPEVIGGVVGGISAR